MSADKQFPIGDRETWPIAEQLRWLVDTLANLHDVYPEWSMQRIASEQHELAPDAFRRIDEAETANQITEDEATELRSQLRQVVPVN